MMDDVSESKPVRDYVAAANRKEAISKLVADPIALAQSRSPALNLSWEKFCGSEGMAKLMPLESARAEEPINKAIRNMIHLIV